MLIRYIDTVEAKKTSDDIIFASNGSLKDVCCGFVMEKVAQFSQLSVISLVMIDASRTMLHRLRSLEYVGEDGTVPKYDGCIVLTDAV
jgi:hypothetical protein